MANGFKDPLVRAWNLVLYQEIPADGSDPSRRRES